MNERGGEGSRFREGRRGEGPDQRLILAAVLLGMLVSAGWREIESAIKGDGVGTPPLASRAADITPHGEVVAPD